MNLQEYTDYIEKTFSDCGMGDLITDEKAEKFYNFSNMLIETNKVMNLTAITDEKDVVLKHFVDSATICKYIPASAKVIDIGCGAGFPSLPLAILREDVCVTALDSTTKRIDFVKRAANVLSLKNINAVVARAEEYVSDTRETYDICTSRAVARLNILSELCIPYIKVGGSFIAMKAAKADEEYDEAKNAIGRLGCKLDRSESFEFESESEVLSRTMYIFTKTKNTSMEFPRKYSVISKRPL